MSEILGLDTQGGGGDAGGPLVKDVTIETFEKDVLELSMTVPVIVDFWAPWCGPCKELGPALEAAVKAANGAVRMVKVDIDKNKMLAGQLRIQSVPTVYGFFQGRPVDGFQGRIPDSEIKGFIERLIAATGGASDGGPSIADILTAAQAAFDGGDVAGAGQAYSQVAQVAEENSDDHVTALAGLARCQLTLGETEQAQQIFSLIPESKHSHAAVAGVKAALDLAAGASGDIARLLQGVEANPADFDGRYELAEALVANGDMDQGMDQLLAIIEQDKDWNEGAARQKMLTVFEALGPTHPSTLKGRRRLSSILFS